MTHAELAIKLLAAVGIATLAYGLCRTLVMLATRPMVRPRPEPRKRVVLSSPYSAWLGALEDMTRAGLPLAQTDLLEVFRYCRRLRDRNAELVAEKLITETGKVAE